MAEGGPSRLMEELRQIKEKPTESAISLSEKRFNRTVAIEFRDLMAEDRDWTLLLSGISIEDEDESTAQVCRDAFSSKIYKLYLDDLETNSVFISTIFNPTSFGNCYSLTTLFISNTLLSRGTAQLMSAFMEHAINLEALFFNSLTYTEGNLAALLRDVFDRGDGITKDQPKHLGFYQNNINDITAQEIVNVLGTHLQLDRLVLSHNTISNIPNISSMRSLTGLSIGGLTAGPIRGGQLVRSIEDAESLADLSLSGNAFGRDDIDALCQWLGQSRTKLKRLNLRKTNLDEECLSIIVNCVRRNGNLQSLDITDNAIPDSILEDLAESLRRENDTMDDLRIANIYPMYGSDDVRFRIEAYNVRNWAGRRLLREFETTPAGLWSIVLARITDTSRTTNAPQYWVRPSKRIMYTADSIYHLLRHGVLAQSNFVYLGCK